MDPQDKRRSTRVRAEFESLYSLGRQEGAGVLADISYTGARFEGTSVLPEEGSHVRAFVFVQPVCPFELMGRVVRVTEDGFAIEYDKVDEEIQRLVDDAAAMVSTPKPR